MRVELADIITCEGKEMSRQAEVELASFDSKLGRFPIVRKAPFVLKFTNESNKRLLIQGQTEVTIAIPCDRCLEMVEKVFSIVIDKEDCKGICRRCGANLNLSECQCPKTEPDPRMAAIQDIFNKFKEV